LPMPWASSTSCWPRPRASACTPKPYWETQDDIEAYLGKLRGA
jgi:hypothetical protein